MSKEILSFSKPAKEVKEVKMSSNDSSTMEEVKMEIVRPTGEDEAKDTKANDDDDASVVNSNVTLRKKSQKSKAKAKQNAQVPVYTKSTISTVVQLSIMNVGRNLRKTLEECCLLVRKN